ncbi:hypothetical protein DdX_11861 [Ditylenchus destructor]|uniref:Rho-GAP domain-containing protein n=1 Tax=Ditylenchus destructor TaxID=166010 RepID=A0AAD4QXV6_9BILA|nr:hypothetical protein DdX_11861 [Ditylenchus destructor]
MNCTYLLFTVLCIFYLQPAETKGGIVHGLVKKASTLNLTRRTSDPPPEEELVPEVNLEVVYKEFNMEEDSKHHPNKIPAIMAESLQHAECDGDGVSTSLLFRGGGTPTRITETLLEYLTHTQNRATHHFKFERAGMTAMDAQAIARKFINLNKPFFSQYLHKELETKAHAFFAKQFDDGEFRAKVRRAVEMHVPALKVRLFRHIAKVMKKVVECQEETQGVGYDGLAVSWAPSMFNGKDPKGQTSLETKLKFAPIVAQFFKYQNEFFCSYPG